MTVKWNHLGQVIDKKDTDAHFNVQLNNLFNW